MGRSEATSPESETPKHAQTKSILESRCTGGRFQLGLFQPIFVGANEMQESPPDNAPVGNPRNIGSYTRPLAHATPDGKPDPYQYAVGHLGHEIGHRWSAYAAARVSRPSKFAGSSIWALGSRTGGARSVSVFAASRGFHARWKRVARQSRRHVHPIARWLFRLPASGYSYLELYLMGLIAAAEVPDFFIVRPLERIGADTNGRPIFKGQRMRITIQDVIAAEGPRLPDVNHSQRHFNTGIVVIVEHGQTPSAELINRANGIRRQWIDYWAITTGRRASMTVDPH